MSLNSKDKLDILKLIVTIDIVCRDKYKIQERTEMNKTVFRHSLLLILAATIWGTAFVAQSVGMDYVGPYTFTAIRNFIGCIVLLPFIFWMDRKGKTTCEKAGGENTDMPAEKAANVKNGKRIDKKLIIGGICTGTALCIASNLQQYGIMYTSVGKSGFITALYIVLVPVFGLVIGHRQSGRMWIAIAIAVVGMYFLCMTTGSFALQTGDIILLLCAASFAVQILLIDHFSSLVNPVKLAWCQFLVCGILSSIPMFVLEHPTLSGIMGGWTSILYAGALSTGVAYTIQVIAQRDMNPAIASLIMSLESVISIIAGWLILNQHLSSRELLGCLLMFAAIIIVQLPEKRQNS